MSDHDDRPTDLTLEDASEDEDEACPCCGCFDWVRAIEKRKKGVYWVVYCGDCGKPIEEKFNINP